MEHFDQHEQYSVGLVILFLFWATQNKRAISLFGRPEGNLREDDGGLSCLKRIRSRLNNANTLTLSYAPINL